MKKKLMSVLLSLAMVVTMMPAMAMTVFAAENDVNWGYLKTAMSGESQTTVSEVIEVSENTPEAGTRTIKLLTDISAGADDSALNVPSGEKIVLDLNGHMLDRGLVSVTGSATNHDHGGAIEVYGELTIKDSAPTTPHDGFVLSSDLWHTGTGTKSKKINGGIITGGTGLKVETQYQGGGIFVGQNGTVTMKSGTIAGNFAQNSGGGIMIQPNSKFMMLGGSITNNGTGNNGNGGGIDNEGTFELNGGTITNNSSKYGGRMLQ